MGEKLSDSKVENKHYQFSLSALIEKTTVNFECYKLLAPSGALIAIPAYY